MTVSTVEIIGALLLGSSVLTAAVTAVFARKKESASAAEILTRTSIDLIGPLREQIAGLRLEVLELRREVQAAQTETARCHDERDADRVRIRTLELELVRYKAGPSARYNQEQTP